jgi:galactose mutarotase-like enzyme
MFDDDALIFKHLHSRTVTIGTDRHTHRLSVSFPDLNYLGLWAKVNAPYVCIEPWMGCADTVDKVHELKDREGVVELGSGREFRSSIMLRIS